VPLDGPGQHICLLAQLLGIVLSKVELLSRCLVEGDDVVDRLQFGDGHKSDLMVLSDGTGLNTTYHQWQRKGTLALTFRPCATAAILSLTPWIWDTRALALAGSIFMSCSLMADEDATVFWL
jgi:hypothetical protein